MQNFDFSDMPNVLKKKGKIVVPEAMSITHCEKGALKGIWWFYLVDGSLEYSTAAISHADADVFTAAKSGSRGWVRGRVGQARGEFFITIWTCDFVLKVLPGRLLGDMCRKVQSASGFDITYVVDEVGRDLTGQGRSVSSKGKNKKKK
ncbi:MAG: hypothetical protein KKF80_00210 [Candidatus Omnitrophica bacterium]|nr:hypothetical protein [Candidatus Omnitrophota bacterium]